MTGTGSGSRQTKAQAEKKSLNMVIKETLEKALGIRRMAAPEDKNPFVKFCGVWSERDLNAFLTVVADNEKVDSTYIPQLDAALRPQRAIDTNNFGRRPVYLTRMNGVKIC